MFPRRTWGFSVSEKELFLTFDDGSNPETTPWILDELKKNDIKACFFCVGENVVEYPELFHRILLEGHQVGNHTFQHEKGTKTRWSEYKYSIAKTDTLMQSKLFRPPYGRINFWQSFLLSFKYQIVMWTWLSYDYDRSQSIEHIMSQANKIEKGDILLLHDNAKMADRITELLPQLLEKLKKEGYRFSLIKEN